MDRKVGKQFDMGEIIEFKIKHGFVHQKGYIWGGMGGQRISYASAPGN